MIKIKRRFIRTKSRQRFVLLRQTNIFEKRITTLKFNIFYVHKSNFIFYMLMSSNATTVVSFSSSLWSTKINRPPMTMHFFLFLPSSSHSICLKRRRSEKHKYLHKVLTHLKTTCPHIEEQMKIDTKHSYQAAALCVFFFEILPRDGNCRMEWRRG